MRTFNRRLQALLTMSGAAALGAVGFPLLSASASPTVLSGPQAYVDGPSGNSGNITSCAGDGVNDASVQNAVRLAAGYATASGGANLAPYYPSVATDSQASTPGSYAGGLLVISVGGASITVVSSGSVVVDYIAVHGGNAGSGPSTNVYWGALQNLDETASYVAAQGFSGWLVCYNTSGTTTSSTTTSSTTTEPSTTTSSTTTAPSTTTTSSGSGTTTTQASTTTSLVFPPLTVLPTTSAPTTTSTVAVTTSSAPSTTTEVTVTIPAEPGTSSPEPTFTIPSGAASTGAGGAAHSPVGPILGVSGLLVLLGAGLAGLLLRRRRA